MSKNINVRIALKRDTSANWTNYNPVLLNGELILVDTAEGQLRAKIGDGIKTYTQLPFTDEALRALITEVDNNNSAVVVTKNGESRLLDTFNIVKLTQEEYEELEASNSLDPDVLYLTEGGSENIGGSKVVLTQNGVGKELPVFNIVKLSEEEYNQLIDSNTLDPDTLYLTEGNGDEGLTEINEGTPSNISGLVKGNGSTLQAAQAGVDYQTPLTAGADYATPSAVANKQNKITAQGLLKGLGDGSVAAAEAGVDYQAPIPAGTYATPDDVSGAVSGHNSADNAHSALFNNKQTAPSLASSLPASGTALTANTIYAVADAVGTYAFTPPTTGWAHGKFTTGSSVSVSFAGTFMGAAPSIEASKTYEFDVLDGVWAVQEVVSA